MKSILFSKKKSFKDFYTWRKWIIGVKILVLFIIIILVLIFYNQLREPVYCCGKSNQTITEDKSLTYNYDIKAEGGTIKTEKPITFILYKFTLSLNMRGVVAEHPQDNITKQICVGTARNIDTGKYEPCVAIILKKTNESISGVESKNVIYEFVDLNGFEWKQKFIAPRKEIISFDGIDVESIDVTPRQQSDIPILFPIIIVVTTIFSLIIDAISKYLEIEQEELGKYHNSPKP